MKKIGVLALAWRLGWPDVLYLGGFSPKHEPGFLRFSDGPFRTATWPVYLLPTAAVLNGRRHPSPRSGGGSIRRAKVKIDGLPVGPVYKPDRLRPLTDGVSAPILRESSLFQITPAGHGHERVHAVPPFDHPLLCDL